MAAAPATYLKTNEHPVGAGSGMRRSPESDGSTGSLVRSGEADRFRGCAQAAENQTRTSEWLAEARARLSVAENPA
jgi:hypothetical protein